MKMNFLFGNVFWGVLLLLWGLLLVLKGFGVIHSFPFFKIFLAVVIIMFGIKLLVGGSCSHRVYHRTGDSIVHGSGSDYTVVFGSQTVDLAANLKPNSPPLEITAVFGTMYVILPDDIEFEITPTGVFGSVEGPPKNTATQFISTYPVKIEATAVFGKVEFTFAKSESNNATAQTDSTRNEVPPDSGR